MLGLDGYRHEPTSPAMQRAVAEQAGEPSLPPLDPLAESEYLRFSLKELFIATTVAAVLLALFRAFGIFGALAAFIAAVAFTTMIFPRATPGQEPRQRLMFDFVWGVVMPIVCLVFDPFLFKAGGNNFPEIMNSPGVQEMQLHDHAYVFYSLLGWQVWVLCLWLVLGKFAKSAAPFISGMLAVGFAVSLAIGVLLIFPATMGLFYFGIGALGFAPLLTAYTYYRRTNLAHRLAAGEHSVFAARAIFVAGSVIAICLPGAIGVAIYFAVHGWERSLRLFLPL